MTAPQEIVELVERFEDNLAAYTSGNYNEAQLRREFIDPFFKALGWDIDNTAGHAEAYKDVIHEASLKIGEEVTVKGSLAKNGSKRINASSVILTSTGGRPGETLDAASSGAATDN